MYVRGITILTWEDSVTKRGLKKLKKWKCPHVDTATAWELIDISHKILYFDWSFYENIIASFHLLSNKTNPRFEKSTIIFQMKTADHNFLIEKFEKCPILDSSVSSWMTALHLQRVNNAR